MRRSRAPSMQRGGLARRVAPPGATATGGATPAPVAAVVATRPAGAAPRPLPTPGLRLAAAASSIPRRSLGVPRGGGVAAVRSREVAAVTGGASPTVTPVRGSASAVGATADDPEAVDYFKVMYAKRSKKKHKSFLDGTTCSAPFCSRCSFVELPSFPFSRPRCRRWLAGCGWPSRWGAHSVCWLLTGPFYFLECHAAATAGTI